MRASVVAFAILGVLALAIMALRAQPPSHPLTEYIPHNGVGRRLSNRARRLELRRLGTVVDDESQT